MIFINKLTIFINLLMIFINVLTIFMLINMNINESHCGPLFQVERSADALLHETARGHCLE